MKLLLTSNGLSNQSISNALFELTGKPASETVVVFIPTAMNAARGSKDCFINDLNNIKKQGFKFIDIVDVSALPKKIWLPKIEDGDVLFFSGGNTYHLMYWLKKSGLSEVLPELLKTRVYAGISAGSIATNPSIAYTSNGKMKYYEDQFGYKSEEALNLVDFYVYPHFNSPKHLDSNEENLRKTANETKKNVYGLDDESALKVVDGAVTVISEGNCLKL
ncbi:MAG: Type 1 glutamine amidotransferase-like domain-containing protein [Candidatus Falkowbacteria bacterium]|nr:Type 1 glutamine amidotransferase-like domain-containing protein [Candidatus Falkowbacteria bacterium]